MAVFHSYKKTEVRVPLVVAEAKGLATLLPRIYPQFPWEIGNFSNRAKKATQRRLFLVIRDIFPDANIVEDYSHAQLKFPSNIPVELDIWIPDQKVAFEYQGLRVASCL